MRLHQIIALDKRAVDYRKERMQKIRNKKKVQKFLIASGIPFCLNSVWIKDLPMLYYSILDDESI